MSDDDLRTVLDALGPEEQRRWLDVLLRRRVAEREGRVDHAAEAALEPTIRPEDAAPPRPGPPRAALITGATGFVGAFLLDELLRRSDARLFCLVRAADEGDAAARLHAAFVRYELDPAALDGRVVPVVGDLERRRLGLSADRFEALADEVDAIFHVGALPNWLLPYAALRAPNVAGTREVLRLASTRRRKPLHFLSTIGVVLADRGFEAGTLREDADLDACALHPVGYPQSKWAAEQLVVKARARGLPASIYRPPFVSGHSGTGVYKTAGDFVYASLRGAIRFGVVHERDFQISIVPVDEVARWVARLAARPTAIGRDYHLAGAEPLSFRTLLGWIRDAGWPVREEPLDAWLRSIRAAGKDHDLYGFLPLLAPDASGRSPYDAGYLRREVRIDCANTLHELGPGALAGATVTPAVFARYLEYFLRQGLVSPPPRLTGTEDEPPAPASP